MSKKKIYYSESERLYVEEQMTIEEIASRFNVSVRTLKSWKKENDWSSKRKEFLDLKEKTTYGFEFFTRNMLAGMSEDLDKGKKISAGRLYSFARQVDKLLKNKKAETELKKFFEKEEDDFLSEEEIRRIRRDFLGMND